MVNDTINDLLTRIRNGGLANHRTVSVIHTKMNYKITKIFKREGFIKDFKIMPNHLLTKPNTGKMLVLTLKYYGRANRPCITHIKRLSCSSLRLYARYKDMTRLLNGMGVIIVSTSKGVMTDRKARALKLGGELICSIW